VAAVANAEPTELVPVLLQAQPNKVRLEQRDEQKYKEKLLARAKVITESANKLWRMLPRPSGDHITYELIPFKKWSYNTILKKSDSQAWSRTSMLTRVDLGGRQGERGTCCFRAGRVLVEQTDPFGRLETWFQVRHMALKQIEGSRADGCGSRAGI